MSVKKIFIILVTIVLCVVLGAFALNVLMPNVTTSIVNTVEDMVYNATGIAFDWNGDGAKGATGRDNDAVVDSQDDPTKSGVQVEGFKGGGGSNP